MPSGFAKYLKRRVLRAKIAYSCLADLQNRALVRYTLACQVIMDLAAHAAHARAFLKSVRRLPRFLIFVERIWKSSLIYASSKLRQSFMCHFISFAWKKIIDVYSHAHTHPCDNYFSIIINFFSTKWSDFSQKSNINYKTEIITTRIFC